jgi:uncharacterized protein YicC (UPF0701 family)
MGNCVTANLLRLAWYATCKQFDGMDDKALREIANQRNRADYLEALERLREHVRECERCLQKNS